MKFILIIFVPLLQLLQAPPSSLLLYLPNIPLYLPITSALYMICLSVSLSLKNLNPSNVVCVEQLLMAIVPALECSQYTRGHSTEENRLFSQQQSNARISPAARWNVKPSSPPSC